MSDAAVILVEHGPGGQPACFRAPREVIIAAGADEVAPALARAEAARAGGAWLAGYIAYEAGYAAEPKLAPLIPGDLPGPLVALGVFDAPGDAAPVLAAMDAAAGGASITAPEPLITREAYGTAIARVLDYIAAGDCYQVNLTFPMGAELVSGTPAGLYGRLRRTGPVGHGAYVDLGQGPVVVSRSPELFFRLDEGGRIVTRPMKGTRPRDADPARDAALARDLFESPKDRAENLMIVDLLRNDISRIARVGSVKVPALYAIEHYATVHQMVSEVEGQLSEPASLPALVAALFPCGSVTGAPKIRAMEIIREVEPFPRGVYCGAVGWMAPDGRADFSVAIRTLSVFGSAITMNVGGGVVHGSTADGEWEEALWKARFVKAAVSQD
ncbi:aminodeoxychorismate synthase component I [Pseudogemmobacter humi]|uniref:Aminodeoxychorismate synthase component 1 n=1 Tax=Pseudogemmobacter humi TaxID=2483812 RepID=A0A3P5X6Z1_9RHOB|nr:aminodeoxychorismate synthase component I [Pseudogemmobacter humi]VDC30352.1 Aminodeoxychorismate synthase component 1 [Pseudogemmobacter humi]